MWLYKPPMKSQDGFWLDAVETETLLVQLFFLNVLMGVQTEGDPIWSIIRIYTYIIYTYMNTYIWFLDSSDFPGENGTHVNIFYNFCL